MSTLNLIHLSVTNSTEQDEFWSKIWLNLQKRCCVVHLIYFRKVLISEKERLLRYTSKLGSLSWKHNVKLHHSYHSQLENIFCKKNAACFIQNWYCHQQTDGTLWQALRKYFLSVQLTKVSFVCYSVIKQTLVDEVMGSIPFWWETETAFGNKLR